MKTTARLQFLAVMTTLLPILAAAAAHANGYQGTLNSAETHTGLSISSASGFDTWTFTAGKGDRIIINAVTTSGSLDTTITLYNPQGSVEASTAGPFGGGDQLNWQLNTNGLYTIVVEDYSLAQVGSYNITFFDLAGAVTSPGNPRGGPITSAQTTNGNISVKSDMNAFQFYGQAGERIILNAVTTSGSLDTTIVLYPPNGNGAEASTSGPFGGGDQLDYQLLTNGLYTVVIQDYSLSSTGAYNLTFFTINGALTSSSNPQGGLITSAQTTNGNISVKSDMNAFQFYGQAGERIILNAVATGGSLDTTIVLYPPTGNGAEASTAGPFGGGDELDYQLQTNGLYTVLIRDYSLSSTGSYNLTYFRIPGVTTSPGSPFGGIIVPGQTTFASISSSGGMNEFQFYGTAGQQVTINAVTTSGSLDTTIVLYPPTGNAAEASSAGPFGGGDQLNWRLLTNGLYSVVIRDYSLAAAGRYTLSFSTIPPITNPGIYDSCPAAGLSVSNSLNLLEWDAVPAATGYDLYFGQGITNALAKVGANFAAASFPMPPVQSGKTYEWYAVAHTPAGDLQGPYMWFTVGEPGIRFSEMAELANHQFRFALQGRVIEQVRIQTSTNLSSWTTLATLPSLDCSYDYTDITATNVGRRFYRAVSP